MITRFVESRRTVIAHFVFLQVIARIADGSKFDEFKARYGETLVTGKSLQSDNKSRHIEMRSGNSKALYNIYCEALQLLCHFQ